MGVIDDIGQGATDLWHGVTGQTAADMAFAGAELSAQAQREQLAYLQEINTLPQLYREQALQQLGARGATGFNQEFAGQDELLQRAKESPLYAELMGTRGAGEEALLRQASATGGLRSGNTQGALYDYNTQLANRALTQSYGQAYADEANRYGMSVDAEKARVSELQSLSGLQGYNTQIADTMGGIGSTYAQGMTAAGQANQQGMTNLLDLFMGGVNAGSSVAMGMI